MGLKKLIYDNKYDQVRLSDQSYIPKSWEVVLTGSCSEQSEYLIAKEFFKQVSDYGISNMNDPECLFGVLVDTLTSLEHLKMIEIK